jgi:membrane protease YdiL (CAAX protease family)
MPTISEQGKPAEVNRGNMVVPPASPGWRALQGGAFLAFLAVAAVVPAFQNWPWWWLAPLAAYFLVVAAIPPLRRTVAWLRVGSLHWRAGAATAALIALTSGTLVLYHVLVRPDVTALGAALPLGVLGGGILAGIFFAVLNATLEELVFRGILFDAIESQWGWPTAVVGTAVCFGLGHVSGYPPGWVGAGLAGVYGLLLGLLRVWVRGLALPIVAHVTADATIYGILLSAGAISAC